MLQVIPKPYRLIIGRMSNHAVETGGCLRSPHLDSGSDQRCSTAPHPARRAQLASSVRSARSQPASGRTGAGLPGRRAGAAHMRQWRRPATRPEHAALRREGVDMGRRFPRAAHHPLDRSARASPFESDVPRQGVHGRAPCRTGQHRVAGGAEPAPPHQPVDRDQPHAVLPGSLNREPTNRTIDEIRSPAAAATAGVFGGAFG